MASWSAHHLCEAWHASRRSKDPSTQVGAVIVAPDNTECGKGYNGFAAGVEDSDERLNNRDLKYQFMVHAESNAIIHSRAIPPGSTIYTYPFMPCATCAGLILQTKTISRVVAPRRNEERWRSAFEVSTTMFRERRVELTLIEPGEVREALQGVRDDAQRAIDAIVYE